MNNIPVVEMIYGEKKVTVVMLIVIVNGEKEGDKESLSKLVLLLNDDEGGGLLPADLADPGRHAQDSSQDQVPRRHLLFHLQKHFSLSTYKCHALFIIIPRYCNSVLL